MTDPISPVDVHARAVLAVSRVAPTPADQARLEATIPQFRAMADLLHDCVEARYAVPAITMNPLRSQDLPAGMWSPR